MSRAKGTPKTGGRKAGTLNKTTSDLKKWVTRLIKDNMVQVAKDFKTLSPRDRILILERLFPYVLPKQQAIAGYIQNDVKVDRKEEPALDLSKIPDDEFEKIMEIIYRYQKTE